MNRILYFFLCLSVLSCKKKSEDDAPNPFLGITIYNAIRTHPDTAQFRAASTIPATFTWNFADGSAEITGDSVEHVFDYGYYFVSLKGITSAGKSAVTIKGINTSPYTQALITGINVTKLNLTRPDGSPWDVDNSGPDVYCQLSVGSMQATSSAINNVTSTGSLNLNLIFLTPLVNSQFDQPIVLKIYNQNDNPIADDLMATITVNKNLTDIMTTSLPYATNKPFQTDNVEGLIYFYWNN